MLLFLCKAIQNSNEIHITSFYYPNNDTRFSINSIAKIFASTAVMQLVEDGKISLQQPISDYLEDLPVDWQKITILQLLSHTPGLPDIEDPDTEGLVGGKRQGLAWVIVQNMLLQFTAGEAFSYNATNYLLIQCIIEKYAEMPYEAFIQKNQFDIAEMNHTTYGNSFDVEENKSPTYYFYQFDKAISDYVKVDQLVELSESFPTKMRTEAGVFSTASDISKWIVALQSGKLLKRESSIQIMWNPVKLKDGTYGGFGDILNGYGLGWPIMIRSVHRAVAPIGGGRAALLIYPEDGLAIILFTNLFGIPVHEIADSIAEFYY